MRISRNIVLMLAIIENLDNWEVKNAQCHSRTKWQLRDLFLI